MNNEMIKEIYKKQIMPKKTLGTINALFAFAILLFILVTAFSRCKDGKIAGVFQLTVAPYPFDEATPEQIRMLAGQNISVQHTNWNRRSTRNHPVSGSDQTKSVPAENHSGIINTQQSSASRRNPAEEREWNTAFQKYAQKIEITDTENMHSFYFKIRGFPLNHQNPDYLQIDYEFYNNDMEYLFTFNADNYWNQSGYDDGHWHEYSFTDNINVKFIRKGTYYIVACIPKDNFSTVFYNMIKKHSAGKVELTVTSGIQSLSIFPVMLGFSVFLTIGIILLKKRAGDLARWRFAFINQQMSKYDYILKLPDEISPDPFYIKGIIKRPLKKMNDAELILEQNYQTTYLEVEQDTLKNNQIVYNFYYYNEFPSDFAEIPMKDSIVYKNEKYKLADKGQAIKYQTTYSNGIIENFESKETVYYTPGWNSLLVFETKPDNEAFEVSLARKIKSAKIWKIAKIKEIN